MTDAALLWDRFHRRLLIFAMRRIGSRADAEDVAQDVLQRVAGALAENRLREPEALPGFVFETAKHVCQQWLRKRGRENRAMQTLERESVDEPASPTQPLTDLISEERRGVVRQALQTLAEDDRYVLEQLYALDTDPDELAQRLRITPGALRVRKHRILKRLSAALGETWKTGVTD